MTSGREPVTDRGRNGTNAVRRGPHLRYATVLVRQIE